MPYTRVFMYQSVNVCVANCVQWATSLEGERPSASQETQKFYGRGMFVAVFEKSATCPYPEPEEPNHSRDRERVKFPNSILGTVIQL
jgi:hypothetical protein